MSVTVEEIRGVIAEVLDGRHFFVAAPLGLVWEHAAEETTAWEIFRGRLLPPNQTRTSATFESWNVYFEENNQRLGEPVLSVKLAAERGQLHVVRGLLCRVWEGYDSGGGIILSREVERWVRELVGTLTVADFAGPTELRDALALRVFQANVGLSRLPLTSVEAPLPGFTLGQLTYFFDNQRHHSESGSWHAVLSYDLEELPPAMQTKWLEFLLRATPAGQINELVQSYVHYSHDCGDPGRDTLALLRAVFNDISLSPYTDFVDKTLAFLRHLVQRAYLSAAQHVDFLGWLLRRLTRHLTAYDLVAFHHRGANYPDALLLDAALKDYLRLIEQHPSLFDDATGRVRRQALRMAWLVRRQYEGHPVPDAPTSPGENARVLPPPHIRVPEEQITQPHRRRKRLYDGDPLPAHLGPRAADALRQSAADLGHDDELRELGMALFIDRPLSFGKSPGEPDPTPLVAYEAFSRSIAQCRLDALAKETPFGLTAEMARRLAARITDMLVAGVPVSAVPPGPPAVVSLGDAARAAEDFVILHRLCDLSIFLDAVPDGPMRDHARRCLTAAVPPVVPCRNREGALVFLDGTSQTILTLRPDGNDGKMVLCRGT